MVIRRKMDVSLFGARLSADGGRLSYWQVVSSAPESNFTGRFDAVVSGAMILRHTDPQLGPIQLLCPSSAPRRTTRQIYFRVKGD